MQKKLLPIALIVVGLLAIFYKPLLNMVSSAKLELKIQQPPVIMPSIYKVYANENALDGKYSLFKMLVTNTSSNTAKKRTGILSDFKYSRLESSYNFPCHPSRPICCSKLLSLFT